MSDRRTRLREHGRVVRRIARWEVSRSVGTVDRRTAVLGVVALVLAGTFVGVGFATGDVALDSDIYRVGVDDDDPYATPVAQTPALSRSDPDVTAFERGALDVLVADRPRATPDGDEHRVGDRWVYVAPTRKGQAALAAFRSAVQTHNDRLMAAEENQTAAYPVVVTLRYLARSDVVTGGATTSTDDTAASESTGAGTGGGGDAGGGAPSVDVGSDDPLPVPGLGGGSGLFATQTSGSPASIAPPFPFASLVLAFAFLIPMNFVIQAYGSTMLNERINRRGELLLVAPVTPGDIIAGKTLPYVALLVALTAAIALAVGGGPVSMLAVVPVALLFLASTFVGAMFARSFKELTFVTVAISVFLSSYTFVPAIFTNVTPIALISPLTLVVRDLQGVGVDVAAYAFATGPFYFAAGVLFLLGAGIYREEDLFTQRPVPLKFLDALDSRIRSARSMTTLSALAIPFVFIAELLAIAVLFALPVDLSVPLLLLVIAFVEEVAKSLHIYAGFVKGRFDRTLASALVLGGFSGLGFFLGEKATVVVQLVGLPELALGRAAFAPAGVGVTAAAALLVAPLVLHVVTASVSALGATRDRTWYAGTLVVATVVHALYNLTVVSALG